MQRFLYSSPIFYFSSLSWMMTRMRPMTKAIAPCVTYCDPTAGEMASIPQIKDMNPITRNNPPQNPTPLRRRPCIGFSGSGRISAGLSANSPHHSMTTIFLSETRTVPKHCLWRVFQPIQTLVRWSLLSYPQPSIPHECHQD